MMLKVQTALYYDVSSGKTERPTWPCQMTERWTLVLLADNATASCRGIAFGNGSSPSALRMFEPRANIRKLFLGVRNEILPHSTTHGL